MQRWDQEHYSVPATVLYHRPQRNGRDVIWVQHDAVSEDEKTISRNIVGFTEEFRRNRHGRWISLDRRPDKCTGSPARSNHFLPGPQWYEANDIPF
jgi:hypothetical protein